MRRTNNGSGVLRAVVAIVAGVALLGQVAAEPLDALRHTNPGVPASASSYGAPAVGQGTVAEKTGAFTYQYPIVVPPGRRGMAPALALSYSSSAPLVGDLAAGWSLPLPEIHRERGVPPATEIVGAPSSWRSTFGSGGNLQPFPRQGPDSTFDYRAWGDASFTRYRRVVVARRIVHWEAHTLDGTVHRFEPIPGLSRPNDRYVLASSTDRFGNRIRYHRERTLSRDGIPTDTLSFIEYTDNAKLAVGPFARVAFEYGEMSYCGGARVPIGARLDAVSEHGGVSLRGARPLTKIRTEVRDAPSGSYRPVREITLGYRQTACSGAIGSPIRMLSSIQESARAPDGTWSTLPAVTFEYGDLEQLPATLRVANLGGGNLLAMPKALTWGHEATGGSGPGSRDWVDTYSMLVDIDGDGSQDRVVIDPSGYRLDDAGRPVEWRRPGKCRARVHRHRPGTGFETSWRRLDLPAVWHGLYCSLSAQPAIPPFGNGPAGAPEIGNGEATPINVFRFIDLDGDGLVDIVSAILQPTLPGSGMRHPNCDPGVPNPDWVTCNGPGTDVEPPVVPPYKPRVGQFYDGRYVWRWYRNLGGGTFAETPRFVASPIPLEVIGETASIPFRTLRGEQSGLIDLDGDGLLDAVWVDPDRPDGWAMWRGDGGGAFHGDASGEPFRWSAPVLGTWTDFEDGFRVTLTQNVGPLGTTYLLVGLHDVNGDGRVDVLAEDPDPGQDRLVAFLNTGAGFSSVPEVVRDGAKSSEQLGTVQTQFDGRSRIFWRRVVDFNGDGTLDYMTFVPDPEGIRTGQGTATVQFGVGTSLADGPTLSFPVGPDYGTGMFGRGFAFELWYMDGDLVDLDGDGYADVVGDQRQYGLDPARAPPGLMTRISSGRDVSTHVTYASRTDRAVVGGDLVGIAGAPRWVVRDVTLWSEGRSGPAISSYRYQHAAVAPDELGRYGFRGFREVHVTAPPSGGESATTTTYHEYKPDYRGLPSGSRTVSGATVAAVSRQQ
jgi:hypothetical protein